MDEPIRLINPDDSVFNASERIYHQGIELEKGVVITNDWLERNEDLMYNCWEIFAAYPDVLINSTL